MFKNMFMAGLAALVVPAFAAEWMTDLDAARTKAAAENKAVLVDFTGSDWCGYCIRLKKQVFDTPEFEAYAADKFVLVEIDVPRDVKRVGGAENYQKNQTLCQQYKVSGFPTIMVLNADNKVLGGFVGGQPSLAATKAPLDAALANGERLAAAAKLQGIDRAKLLMEVYKSLPGEMQPLAEDMQKEIAELDTENVTGIQSIAQEAAVMAQLEADLQKNGRDMDKMMQLLNEAQPKVTGANLNNVLQLRMMIISKKIQNICDTADSVEDVAAIKALMYEMLTGLPEAQRKEGQARIDQQFSNPEAILEQIKAARKQKR